MANFIRWNPSTHIYELSTNDGVSFVPLPLNASILNEGSISPAILPAGIAYTNVANTFTISPQSITGPTARLAIATGDATSSYMYVNNTGNITYFGVENSAGTTFGASPYASIIYGGSARNLEVFTNGAKRLTVDASGNTTLAGNLTVGDNITLSANAVAAYGLNIRGRASDSWSVNQFLSSTGGTRYGYLVAEPTGIVLANETGTAISLALRSGVASISGALNVSGTLTVVGGGYHYFTGNGGNGPNALFVQNTANGAADFAGLRIGNNANSAAGALYAQSAAYSTAGARYASGVSLEATDAGGMSISSIYAPIRFYCNSDGSAVERMRITPAGDILVGVTVAPGGLNQKFSILANANAINSILTVCNSYSSYFGNHIHFMNYVGGTAGYISQTGAGSVAYNTTSDKRLKIDKGIVTDISALESVVVHDFEWITDGKLDRGVFAQDVHPIFPRAVTVGDKDMPWATDYSKFVPDLIVGWQQNNARIAKLEEMICRLLPQN